MRRIKWTPVIVTMMIIALAVTLSYVGCGGSSSNSGSSAPTVTLGAAVSDKGMVTFNQNVVATDLADGNGFNVPFPGQGNYWDIDTDFSLADGADDQFDNALNLAVSGTDFATDQTYNELTWMTPAFGVADGIKVAGVITSSYSDNYTAPISGSYSATLNNLTDARLMQTINLAGAATPITLTWSYDYSIMSSEIQTTDTAYFKLVIRNTAGVELETIYSEVITDTSTSNSDTAVTASLTAYAGQSIVLSFEARYSRHDWSGYCLFDAVSVKGDNGTEYVTNGDFEGGTLAGWTTNSPVEYQNITSGSRNITDTLDADMDLTVTRSFYTEPNKLWGRWVDVFENNTVTATCVTLTYHTNLGNDTYGIIYEPTGANGKALASWDGSDNDRDLGLVFGQVVTTTYLSDDGLNNGNGSDDIDVYYSITVPASSKVAIVNFIVMNGINTGDTASAITDKATAIDTEVLKILNNFWSDVQYRRGMTQEQIDAVLNFPK